MRILVIIPYYKPAYHYGGPIRSVATVCEALVRAGHTIKVLTTNAGGKQELAIDIKRLYNVDGVEVKYFKRITSDPLNFSPSLLREVWRDIKLYDVVHVHTWWNLVTVPTVFLCWIRGIRPVVSPRGSVTTYTFTHQKNLIKRGFHSILGKRLLQHCLIHVTSRQEKEDVRQYVTPYAIHEVPNMLEFGVKSTMSPPEASELRLLYFGRIDRKKNLEFLFAILRNQFTVPFYLEIVGEGEADYIEELKASTLGQPAIHWLGGIYDQGKWDILASSHIMLLPSYNENYGNVVLEALSQGTAVLLSEEVGLMDYVRTNRLGWVAPLQHEAWRKILQEVWRDQTELRRIRTEAPICIQRDFEIQGLVKRYEKMYQSL